MIVDTSAVVAIALAESDSEKYLRKISEAFVCRMEAGTWIELAVVIQRRYPTKADLVDDFLRGAEVIFEPVTVEQAALGREAFKKFGQSSGHRARLNFGDCFSYALAKATGEPLLFKGNDFSQTDIAAA